MSRFVHVVIDESTSKTITGLHEYDRDNGGILKVPAGSAFPGTPSAGEMFWRTDENKLYRRNSGDTAWDVISAATAAHTLGGSDHTADTLANLNSKVSDATLIDTGDSRLSDARTPTTHNLAGSEHGADTLSNLNSKVSDATLIDTGDSRLSDARTPTAHTTSHKHGGSDEVATATPAANAIPKADGSGTLDSWVTHTDTVAIHDNVSAEISAITEKTTPVNADLLLIEDSAASNAKKRVQIGNLPSAFAGQQVYYVGKHGSDSNDGKSPATAFLTVGKGLTEADGQTPSATNQFVVWVIDAGVYAQTDLTVSSWVTLYAPAATIQTAMIVEDDSYTYVRTLEYLGGGSNTRLVMKYNDGTGTAYVRADFVHSDEVAATAFLCYLDSGTLDLHLGYVDVLGHCFWASTTTTGHVARIRAIVNEVKCDRSVVQATSGASSTSEVFLTANKLICTSTATYDGASTLGPGSRLYINAPYFTATNAPYLFDIGGGRCIVNADYLDGGTDLSAGAFLTINGTEWTASEGESGTTSTDWQQKLRLTVTPEVAGEYMILAHASLRCSDSSGLNASWCQLELDDTTQLGFGYYTGSAVADSQTIMWVGTLSAAAHTFDLDYTRAGTSATAYISNARIVARRIR